MWQILYRFYRTCLISQGGRLPHACTSVACLNGIRHIELTCSWALLACSYFTKVQPCRLDFILRNQAQVNTFHVLLLSFVCFHVRVNSLAFTIRNFRPYSSEFVSHVASVVRLKQHSASSKKSNAEKKGKQTQYKEREKKQKMARFLELRCQ